MAYEVGGRGRAVSERSAADMAEAPPAGQMRTGQDPAMLRSSAEVMEGPVIVTVSVPPSTESMPPHSTSAIRQIAWEQSNIAMVKKVIAVLDLQMPAGKATMAPPFGSTLGPYGINTKALLQIYNEKTASQVGTILPVEITIYEDRSFTITTKTPLPETPPALDVAGESTEDTAAL